MAKKQKPQNKLHLLALEFCFTKETLDVRDSEAIVVACVDYGLVKDGNYSAESLIAKAVENHGKPKCFRFVMYGPTEVLE